MIGLSIEHKDKWYEPEFDIHPIGDYSETKKHSICLRFEVSSVDELKPGMCVENRSVRVIVVEIDD